MGRHVAEVSDVDALEAEFATVDSGSIYLFTDKAPDGSEPNAHNNLDPAYKWLPVPVRHRTDPDTGRKYKPRGESAYIRDLQVKARAYAAGQVPWAADIEGTDEDKLANLARRVDVEHTTKVLPPTAKEVPARIGVPLVLMFMGGGVFVLAAQFIIAIAQGGVA